LVSTKLDTFCYPTVHTALRAVVLTQYRRVPDRQTDGIAIASTALARRALRALLKAITTTRRCGMEVPRDGRPAKYRFKVKARV